MHIPNRPQARVWAPDAVLAPPPGYTGEPPASSTISFFGVDLPPEAFLPQPQSQAAPPPAHPTTSSVWAPDAVLAPPPGYTGEPPASSTISFFGAEIPASALFPPSQPAPHSSQEQPSVWAPDAVLAPPPGYTGEPSAPATINFFGVELPPSALFPPAEPTPAPAPEPHVWAPDAVLAAPPGYKQEKPEPVSYFGMFLGY